MIWLWIILGICVVPGIPVACLIWMDCTRKPMTPEEWTEYEAQVERANRMAERDGLCYDIRCFDDSPHPRHT